MDTTLSNLSDAQLLDLCRTNNTIDPNCMCLISGGGPEINTDISGPGVRISFYLQALFLGLTSARSVRKGENEASLYTLVSTNIAMVLTSFILGFKSEPAMSLHDAIVVLYLLGLSWVTIFSSFPTYNRYRKKDNILRVLYVVHSYLIFALFFSILITAPKFGLSRRCNRNAVVVLFGDIPALSAGRFIAFAAVGIATIVFSFLVYFDCKINKKYDSVLELLKARFRRLKWRPDIDGVLILWRGPSVELGTSESGEKSSAEKRRTQRRRKANNDEAGPSKDKYDPGVDGRLVINLVIIVIPWAIFVMNSELLIKHNRFEGGGDGIGPDLWNFGQIFPVLILLLPMVNLFKVFKELHLRRYRRSKPVHATMTQASSDVETGDGPGLRSGFAYDHAQRPGHRPRFGQGERPRRPQPTWSGAGRRPWADFMGPFSSHHFGRQTGAHISVDSLHSDSSKYAEYATTGRADKGKVKVVRASSGSETYHSADEPD